MSEQPLGFQYALTHEDRFLREEKQAILATAVGIARLRLRTGDPQGASDILDKAVDECHRKHFDACVADGHSVESVERFIGPRGEEVERVRV